MMSCWQNEPEARPAFPVLTKQLRKMENQHKVRFNINIKYYWLSLNRARFNYYYFFSVVLLVL